MVPYLHIFMSTRSFLIDALSLSRIFRLKATNEDSDLYSDGWIVLLRVRSLGRNHVEHPPGQLFHGESHEKEPQ